MLEVPTDRIRNVALVGNAGAGKTTLAEALLHRCGGLARPGRVEDGTTASDTDPDERERGMSLSLSVLPFSWRDHRVNLIDTPGYPDFVGEVTAALSVVDLAVFVVSALDGVQAHTERIWGLADDAHVPRLVFVNKLDHERADFAAVCDELRDRLGPGIAPLELPLGAQGDLIGVADLLTDTARIERGGATAVEAVPDDLAVIERGGHDRLVEGIVVADDALLERYLDGDIPSVDELEHALLGGLESTSVFPVLCGSASNGVGVDRLADLLVELGPPPGDRPREVMAADATVAVPADPAGAPLAVVFKTLTDPYVGQVSLLAVLSGTIHDGDQLLNPRTGAYERLHGLFRPNGTRHDPVSALLAGDIGGVTKLADTATGDTLAPRGTPVRVPAPAPAEPVLSIAVVPRTQADDDKLTTALHRLHDEDPALSIHHDDETHQTLLRGQGETHLQVAVSRLARRFGVHVDVEDVRVPYRETITATTTAECRHRKQTGGHGQFAACTLEVEPLERGAGFEFADRIAGGAISKSYVAAVRRGVAEALEEGGPAGHPVVDVGVTLLDGKEHPVDSSEMAFRAAGRLAVRAALEQAGTLVLEPISHLEVTVPAELQGEVIADLNARRGRIRGSAPDGTGAQVVEADVPAAELTRYATDLRSISAGRGSFRVRHARYDVLRAHDASWGAIDPAPQD